MKLSEAIRLGAMLRPQTYAHFSTTAGTCALGAAGEAVGLNLKESFGYDPYVSLLAEWPILRDPVTLPKRPTHPESVMILDDAITYLNDWQRWTREAIADWVQTIEPQEPVEVRDVAQGRESLPDVSLVLDAVTEAK